MDNEITLVARCFRRDKILDSQCFQRAANPARLGKGLREQGKFPAPVKNHQFKHSFCPLSAGAECSRGSAALGFMRGGERQKGSPFLVGTYVIYSSSSHVFPTLCPSNFMLREQVHKCITSRKLLWKRSLSFRVDLHWRAIR